MRRTSTVFKMMVHLYNSEEDGVKVCKAKLSLPSAEVPADIYIEFILK